MSRLSWELDGVSGQWSPVGFYLEKREEHPPCPLPSPTYAAWTADGGILRVVKLGTGARYECDSAVSRQGSLWPAGQDEIAQDFSTTLPTTVGLEFCSRRAGLELRLDESVRLGLASSVERVEMRVLTPSPVDVVFCRQDDWTAHVDLTFADLEGNPALLVGDIAQEVRLPALWTWKPGLPGVFFETDGVPGEPVSRVKRRDRSRRLGIAFDSQMPSGTVLTIGRGTWKLAEPVGGSASPEGTFRYVLAAERTPTLSNLAPDGRLISATLLAGQFRVDINEDLRKILDWSVGSGGRYCIEFRGTQIDASAPGGERDTWDYGPHQPLLLGQDTANLTVFKSDGNGQWAPNMHPRLVRGRIPAPFTTGLESAYVVVDSSDRRRYGVFAARHVIPTGQWRATGYLAGRSLVCWRGLVDVCMVQPLNISLLNVAPLNVSGPNVSPGREVRTMVFEHGFALQPSFWFAAPFLGMAMVHDESVAWWGLAEDCDRASLSRDVIGWRIQGEWLDIDQQNSTATRRAACRLDPPFRFCWAGLDSGPILSVGVDEQWPTVCGYVANECGVIATPDGAVSIAVEDVDQGEYRLASGETPPSHWPAEVRHAAIVATGAVDHADGVVDNIEWSRDRQGSIELRRLAAPQLGIYVFEPASSAPER
jgi:hypothetical protein